MSSAYSPFPLAKRRASVRLVAKSTHGLSINDPGIPFITSLMIFWVPSTEPVSTMTQWSMRGLTDSKHLLITLLSSLTIILKQIFILEAIKTLDIFGLLITYRFHLNNKKRKILLI